MSNPPKSTRGIGRHSHQRDDGLPRLADRQSDLARPEFVRDLPLEYTPVYKRDGVVSGPRDGALTASTPSERLQRDLARLGWALERFPKWRLETYLGVELSDSDLEAIGDAMLAEAELLESESSEPVEEIVLEVLVDEEEEGS